MLRVAIPFRNNPEVLANWRNEKSGRSKKGKRSAYYEIGVDDGNLTLGLREEKKRFGGSDRKESNWCSYFEFELDSNIARDLKMFLNNYVEGDAPEVKNDN